MNRSRPVGLASAAAASIVLVMALASPDASAGAAGPCERDLLPSPSGGDTCAQSAAVGGSGAASPAGGESPTPEPSLPQCRIGQAPTLNPSTIVATGSATVTVHDQPNYTVHVYAYTRPSTDYRLLRIITTDSTGTASFQVRPSANTRLKAHPRQYDCAATGEQDPSVVLNVRAALTLAATRTGPLRYTFSGDSVPARPGGLVVNLYRVGMDGAEALAGHARASATTGEWAVRLAFAGPGQVRLIARTGQDMQNAPGASHVRSVVVY